MKFPNIGPLELCRTDVAGIHAEIGEPYHPPSGEGEKVDVEGAVESGGRDHKSHRASQRETLVEE